MRRIQTCRMRWFLPAMLCLLGHATSTAAQDAAPPDSLRLSLAEAVARAVQESEEMAATRAQVDQAAARVTQATATALPQLSAGVTYNRAIKTIFDNIHFGGADAGEDSSSDVFKDLPFGRRNNYIANLQLSQLLFAGGSVGAARRAATLYRSASTHQLEEAVAELTLRVRVAYLNAVVAQRLHEIALASRDVAEAHLRQVESFFRAGTASEFEVLRAQVDLENRDPAVVQSRNAVDLAVLELKRLVNVPSDQPLVLTTRGGPEMVEVDEQELARLVEQRPVLRAAREMVEMREATITVYRGQRFPSLRLIGNLGFQAFPETVAPPGFADWREDWSVSLAVSWNIFDGLGTRGRIAEAQAQLRQTRAEEAQLREGLEVELASALAEYEMARAQIEARRETAALAERALGLAESRFASGLSTQLEVSDAALLLDEARVNEVQAVYDYVKALARLERLSGGKLELLRFP